MQFLLKIHAIFMNLYLKKYREEYSDELRDVFELSLNDASRTGKFEVACVALRELISLPQAILNEHLREMRKMTMKPFASRFDFAPGSRTEIFAALAPFLLFGALPTLLGWVSMWIVAPVWLEAVFAIALLLVGLSLFVIGFAKGVPRWFMPYLGTPMSFLSMLLFTVLMEKWQGVWWYRLPGFLSDFLQQGLLWAGLIFLVVLLLVATQYIPRSRPFHQRIRDDWTLISFVIYGAMPLVLALTFDDYSYEEPHMFLALLILAVGGWLYLQSRESIKKFLYLYGGMALSMLTAAVVKAALVESSFPSVSDTAWQIEFMSTLITWLWLALIMLIPPVAHFFFWYERENKPAT